jgi:tyrosine-protein phosphatase YwqE
MKLMAIFYDSWEKDGASPFVSKHVHKCDKCESSDGLTDYRFKCINFGMTLCENCTKKTLFDIGVDQLIPILKEKD